MTATAPPQPLAVEHLVDALVGGLFTRQIEQKPLAILQHGMAALDGSRLGGAQKKALLICALERLAYGPDGLPGTSDDILPPVVVAGLRALVDSGVLEGVIDLAHKAVRSSSWSAFRCPCACLR
jgi:hypothetical protein